MLTAGGDGVLPELAVAVGIGVPYLIDVVSAALACPLSEVEWREVGVAVGEQGVAHEEILVELGVASRDEIRLPGILALELGHVGFHRGRAYLHPDEFPVEVQGVLKHLTRLEGRVVYAALGEGSE